MQARAMVGGRRRRAAGIGCLAAAALVVLAPAARGEVFTVRGVDVDVTAASAAVARGQALADGRAAAAARLLARLTRRSDADLLPALEPADIDWLLQDFEVTSEKTSTVRYVARLTCRFRAASVGELLRRAGVPYAETPSKPVLVVPVLRDGGRLLLWETPNPWRDAWAGLGPRDGLVPMIVPTGDLEDISDLGAAQAAAGEAAALDAVAGRYGAADSLVAIAAPGIDAAGRPVVAISIARIGTTAQEPLALSVAGAPGTPPAALMTAAAAEAAAAVEDAWIGANLLRFDEQNRLVAAVPLSGLDDWVLVRERLAGVAVIAAVGLRQLTRGSAEVEVAYIGDEAQLGQALAQQDLVLQAVPGAGRVLRLAGRGG